MIHRLSLTLLNILFPPLTTLLIAGPGMDLVLSCILFLLGVIPSHIHGFYLTCTYFSRKKKVRKGRWPGKWKPLIYSEKVQYGGVSARQVRLLKQEEEEEKSRKSAKRGSWRSRVSSFGKSEGEKGDRREASLSRDSSRLDRQESRRPTSYPSRTHNYQQDCLSRPTSYQSHVRSHRQQQQALSRTPSYQDPSTVTSPTSQARSSQSPQQTSPTQLYSPEMTQRNSYLTYTPSPTSPVSQRFRNDMPPTSYYYNNIGDVGQQAQGHRSRSTSRTRQRGRLIIG